jgi:hypothetical protein
MSDPKVKDDPRAARKAAAEARVRAALDLIQEAQMLLGRACAALSSVQGMNPSWREVGKRYDQVHGTWYTVERKAASVRARGWLLLDHEPRQDELAGSREAL